MGYIGILEEKMELLYYYRDYIRVIYGFYSPRIPQDSHVSVADLLAEETGSARIFLLHGWS